MKKVFIQILKALGYFAVYFTAQNLVTMVMGFMVGMMYGPEIKETAASYEEYMAQLQQHLASYNGICLIVSAVLVLLTYFIIEKVKKTSIIKETDTKKVSGKHIGLTVIAAVGSMFFLNFMLTILPIPADLMGALSNGMSKLTAYPMWQALLANSLLVPIMEEVVFRGYLYSRLSKAMPEIVVAIITSAIFGICHGGIVWAAWAFLFGMIICVFRMKTGSIIPGIIFHIIMNTFSTLTSYTSLFDGMTETVMYVLTIVGGILLAGSLAVTIAGKKTALAEKNAEVTISSAKI
ncbi:MAG: CPBP family intramembrane metalloprotease [Clostridiales bacterium]|nr:CPBP family intramembrane metalloprotease [Clostridiales bacterium]